MKLTCSIAMATYNGERFLQEQLDSLAMQTVLPDELVVCDDASTDGTVRILRAFAETAPFPVRIVENQENIGVFKNFEQVVTLCEKDIIFFCDQDDVWRPEKIEKVMSVFEAEPEVGMVFHDLKDVDQDLNSLPVNFGSWRVRNTGYDFSDLPSAFRTEVIVPILWNLAGSWHGCAMAYRRKWTPIMLPFVGYHDRWILNFLACFTKSRFLSEKLICYRHHANNVTASIVPKKRKSFFRFIPRFWRSIKKRYHIYRDPDLRRYLKRFEENLQNFWQRTQELMEIRQIIVNRLQREAKNNVEFPEVVEFYKDYIRFSRNIQGMLTHLLGMFLEDEIPENKD